MDDVSRECLEQVPCACLKTDYPVSFAIFALARSHRAKAASMLADIGLFPGQEILLMQLAEKDGKPQKSLCESIGLDHSTVAKSVARLERDGAIDHAFGARDEADMFPVRLFDAAGVRVVKPVSVSR